MGTDAFDTPTGSVACPSCGGAGGGPFGRAGGAWDDEEFLCPRCEGAGAIRREDLIVQSVRPGLAKAIPDVAAKPIQKRRTSA